MRSSGIPQPGLEPIFPRVVGSNVELVRKPADRRIIPGLDRGRFCSIEGAVNRGSGLGGTSTVIIQLSVIFKRTAPELPLEVGLDATERREPELQNLVLLGEPVVWNGSGITSRGGLDGHFVAEDIEDAVHVLDEVELDDGRPDQTFLFPGPRGVFQLEICEADDTSRFRIGTSIAGNTE